MKQPLTELLPGGEVLEREAGGLMNTGKEAIIKSFQLFPEKTRCP